MSSDFAPDFCYVEVIINNRSMDRHGAIKMLQIWFRNCVTSLTVLTTRSSGRPCSCCRQLLLSHAGIGMCRYEMKPCVYIYIEMNKVSGKEEESYLLFFFSPFFFLHPFITFLLYALICLFSFCSQAGTSQCVVNETNFGSECQSQFVKYLFH